MWGVYGGVSEETERLKQIGFTHVLGLGADYERIWQAGAPTEAADAASRSPRRGACSTRPWPTT